MRIAGCFQFAMELVLSFSIFFRQCGFRICQILCLGLFFVAAPVSMPAFAGEKLTVLLDWFVNPDHAPLIVARHGGFFESAGLEVELIAPADPSAPPRLVAARQGDIAITYQPVVHGQIAGGLPLAVVGVLVSTPLNSLIVLEDGPVKTLRDLEGRKIGFSVSGFEDAMLSAMLGSVGLGLDDVELVNVNFALTPALMSGQVDAIIGGYRNFELTQLAIEGARGRIFFPEEHGVPIYDELIYVIHRDSLDEARFRKFIEAVEAATAWLTNHPDEAWEIFIAAYPALDDRLNASAWADTLPRFSRRPGAIDLPRYRRFAEFLQGSGIIGQISPPSSYVRALD